MQKSRYWSRWERKRLSRRRLLAGASALGAGAAGVALVGCGGGGGGGEEGGTPEPQATPTGGRIETGRRTPAIWHSYGFDPLPLDSMDPHQTQFGPIYNMHAMVFSRVLTYVDDVNETIVNDLAESMPEQVDETTYVIKLRPNIKFHDNPKLGMNSKVNARQLVADDVKFSIERQLNLNSPMSALFYRRSQWEHLEKIELVDDLTLQMTTKRPCSAFIHFLADRNAFIVPREVISEGDEMNTADAMIGSGPFLFDKLEPLVVLSTRRNPEWHAADDNVEIDGVPIGVGRPFLDGVEVDGSQITVTDDTAQELAFRSKQKDVVSFSDHTNEDRVIAELPELAPTLMSYGTSGLLNSRFLMDRPPYDDVRVRRAIHLAVDRQTLGQKIWRGYFRPSANVGWPQVRWALPQEELRALPGYRTDPADREADIAEAKALWEEVGGNDAVGTIKIEFAGIPDYVPRQALPEMERVLKEVLGANVETKVDPAGYVRLAEGYLNNTLGKEPRLPFGWGYDNGYIHWFDWLYPFHHSGSTKNSFILNDPLLDGMLDDALEDFEYESAREKVLEIQRYLLDKGNDGMGVLAQLPYICEADRDIAWPYVKNRRGFTWFGHADWYANMWFDQDDPSYAGRPT